jgi:glucosamine--fructose-6-phosphate aminotransferase (isomerizing)
MHEMAKLPAVGMSSAQFRHGPVEVVNKGFQAIMFGSQPATADIDLKLAQDLAQMGATVGWIGPSPGDGKIHSLCSWPDHAAHRFAPVLEVIPAQMLSLRLTESAGIEPGRFRYLAQVTLSETGFAGL